MANYNFEKTVLDMHSFYYTLPCQVTNTGLTADSNGKKIIKAGTPVGGDTNALLNRDTAVLIATNDATNGPKTQGVVIHDVDVTAGQTTATVAFAGVIDMAKMDAGFALDSKVTFPHDIIYMKGRGF
ncbi:MAG: hypothetical protein PUH07_08520 [Methanobrevibacter smithii]|jgi:hypothetical protein|nr:hypothetical protein [Methanobrevibacter smithii]MDD7245132.1 hypothetical protein [Methanobrevibacter smithii]